MTRTRTAQSGYVLLMTLLLLALAGTALACLARQSLGQSLQALEAQENLQRHWAVWSCQRVLLPKVEAILADEEAQSEQPVAVLRKTITLGDQQLTLVLTDEQAKANINGLLEQEGQEKTQKAMEQLLQQDNQADDRSGVVVDLHPLPGREAQESPAASQPADQPKAAPRLGSYDQVLTRVPPEHLIPSESSHGLAQYWTCWGSGSLHFRRASETALRMTLAGSLTEPQIQGLLDFRAQMPGQGAAAALTQVGLDEAQRQAIEPLFTDQSTCHGLWILWSAGQRPWYRLAIRDESQDGDAETSAPELHVFDW